eukprot:5034301-Pyramimonas_sp.AAC.1
MLRSLLNAVGFRLFLATAKSGPNSGRPLSSSNCDGTKNCNNEGSGGSGSMYLSKSAASKMWPSIALPIALHMLAGCTFLAAVRNSPDSFLPVSVTYVPRGCEQKPLPG